MKLIYAIVNVKVNLVKARRVGAEHDFYLIDLKI